MPGLKLTREQACRLWGVGHETCAAALEVLKTEGFLYETATGKYVALPRPSGAAIGADERSVTTPVRCPHCGKRNVVQRSQTALGHGLALTVRCAVCERIITLTEMSA